MFKSINRLDSFGVFQNFRSGTLVFRKRNLIYGRNYSGKTTLSRAFRSLEKQQKHPDFLAANFETLLEDGSVCSPTIPLNGTILRVFNADFVAENLQFSGGDAAPILVLGAADIAKEQLLQAKQADLRAERNKRTQFEGEATRLERQIKDSLSRGAKEIKTLLQRPDYEKRHFEKPLGECAREPDRFILSDEDYQTELSRHRSTKLPELTGVAPLAVLSHLEEKARMLLSKVVLNKTSTIGELLEDGRFEKWLRDGLALHTDKNACSFCGNPLSKERLAHLASCFSEEYSHLVVDLEALSVEIERQESFRPQLPHLQELYPEIRTAYSEARSKLEDLLQNRSQACKALASKISEKKMHTSREVAVEPLAFNDETIAEAVGAINRLVMQHNDRTRDFDNSRTAAFTRLENHIVSCTARDSGYLDSQRLLATAKTDAAQSATKINELQQEIEELERETSETARGAQAINEHLEEYFGKADICIVVTSSNRFQISRAGAVATNLSEGEKTAIAFAYFVTLVEDGRIPINDTIVFVDDPISSLDSNHIFNTYAMIKTRFAQCRQVFLSTHSFEFFCLLRDWCKEDEDRREPAVMTKWNVFILERSDSGASALKQVPTPLWRFNSEYVYLFSIIHAFDKAQGINFDQQLGLPNVIRRFLEAFSGIMIPRRAAGLKQKMVDLFPNEVARERVWKFINQYSHNRSITAAFNLPDTTECLVAARACLDCVQQWDQRHFDELERSVV